MKRIHWALVALLLALLPARGAAQGTGTIQGTVVDGGTQLPLSGASVSVEGTTLGTVTTARGTFQLVNVPAGERVIRVQLIGYGALDRTVTVVPGAVATVRFALNQEAVALDELVVTALGIEREARSLTTATQQVSGAELTEVRDQNLVSALTGKVSGVQIVNSNTPGGSARIVIRGANSITGDNQPLFVVDGIPVSNAAGHGGAGGSWGYNAIDYGNAISDINPNDIESISVLKGPNAAALYGSRAANGAVIITTKRGRVPGGRITVSTNVTFETPLKLPEYQNEYGQGWNGRFSFGDANGDGSLYADRDESWGPRLDDGLEIPQFYSNGEPVPWVSHPDNVRNFFETGRTLNTNASFSTATENSNVRFSVSRMDQDGMYPGFRLQRTNVTLAGGSRFTERLTTDVSVHYTKTDAQNRPSQGYGTDNVMWQFLWFGRQVDTRLLKERQYRPDGSQFTWNQRWNNNPYWTALVNRNEDGRNRVIGVASLTYEFTPWLSGTVRSGTDWSEEHRRHQYMAGTIGDSNVGDNGAFGETNIFRRETTSDFLLTGNWPEVGDYSVTVNVGGSRRDTHYRDNSIYIRDLVVPNLFTRDNSAVDLPALSDWRSRQRVNSLYGSLVLGYRGFAFLEATGRNDWSSTLPESNNSYFYPSVSGSVILTEAFPSLRGGLLSHAKVRAAWAQVGNDAPPYQLIDPFISDVPFQGAPRLSASNVLRNANLKPERTQGWEIGAELGFLDDRLRINADYAHKATIDQIMPVAISPITGFSSRYVNAGKMSARSLELTLGATPVRLDNGFEWDLTASFTRTRETVDALTGDLESLSLGSYYDVSVEARPGERYGNMYGRLYVRDSKGNIVVGEDGLPLNSSENPIGLLGNYNPDWVGSLRNRFTFRGLELAFQLDTRQGGVLYSMTNRYGRRSGVLIETLVGREDSATQRTYVVPGVKVVDGDTVPNDIPVMAQEYHRALGAGDGIAEAFTYDASFVKLREVSLTFDVPARVTDLLRVSDLRVGVVGRNLFLWSDVPHVDPETAFSTGNLQGYEYSQFPSARSFGFNVSVTP
ncbi:MAG TPA: SusC/RagA family TonB-linked outer membrane protein [Longimicrobiales bacterium]